MSQAITEEQTTETEAAVESAAPTFAAYVDIHNTGGVDSTPAQILANTCQSCFLIFPAGGVCNDCD